MLNKLLFSAILGAIVVGSYGYTPEEIEGFVRAAPKYATSNGTLPDSYNEAVVYHPLPPPSKCIGKLFCKILQVADVGIPGNLFLKEGWLTGVPTFVLDGPVVEIKPDIFQIFLNYTGLVRVDYNYAIFVSPDPLPVNKGRGFGDISNFQVSLTVKVEDGKIFIDSLKKSDLEHVHVLFRDSAFSELLDYIINAVNATFERLFVELIIKRYAWIISEYSVKAINAAAQAAQSA